MDMSRRACQPLNIWPPLNIGYLTSGCCTRLISFRERGLLGELIEGVCCQTMANMARGACTRLPALGHVPMCDVRLAWYGSARGSLIGKYSRAGALSRS